MKPSLYLDINGVLLDNTNRLTIGASDFIVCAVTNFDVYWLTTYCMNGDPTRARQIVYAAEPGLLPYIKQIKSTSWSLVKTEAIDFSQPFLWFDDNCSSGDWANLKQNDVTDCWIEVDLNSQPNQLKSEANHLQSIVA